MKKSGSGCDSLTATTARWVVKGSLWATFLVVKVAEGKVGPLVVVLAFVGVFVAVVCIGVFAATFLRKGTRLVGTFFCSMLFSYAADRAIFMPDVGSLLVVLAFVGFFVDVYKTVVVCIRVLAVAAVH